MEPLPKAQQYLFAAGKAHHLLELGLAGVDAGRAKADLLAEILASQNDDGSFPGSRPQGEPGSVFATSRRVDLLARAGEAEPARRGAAWLAALQRADGGFAENPALAATLDPSWDWYSVENAVTWMTGEALVALALVGGFEANVTAARNLLLRARNADGGWPGQVAESYPDRTDLWTVASVVQGLLAAGIAPNHDVFSGLAGALARQKDRWQHPIENPLPALMALGRRGVDGDVQECLKLLAKGQNKDGGWGYFAGDDSHPDPSTSVVVIIARYRLALPA